eukprot:COSAG01_NODE_1500_length_10110_cov_4.433923_3_plen_93_part_00
MDVSYIIGLRGRHDATNFVSNGADLHHFSLKRGGRSTAAVAAAMVAALAVAAADPRDGGGDHPSSSDMHPQQQTIQGLSRSFVGRTVGGYIK